jgi:nucleoside-diphosphate-sugar epimerase
MPPGEKPTVHVLILGCGYTGERVAARFLARGARVTAAIRHPQRLAHLGERGAAIVPTAEFAKHTQPGMLVLHSIPPDGSAGLLEALHGSAARIVYLSSTAVYGDATHVDQTTPVQPHTQRAQDRLQVEQSVAQGPWSWLILRPAAIYGPARGVHESIKHGTHSMSDRYVSRIHVDDLAAHAEAALLSPLSGAYPVADEEPCTSLEIAEFCSRLLHVPMMNASRDDAARPPRFAMNRRVDGSAIRRALNLTLRYPSYRVGIPAALFGDTA